MIRGNEEADPYLLGNFTYYSFRKGVLKFTDYDLKCALKKAGPNDPAY